MTINVYSDLGNEQIASPTGSSSLTRNFIGFFVYRTSNVNVGNGDNIVTYQAATVDTNSFFPLPGTTATIPVGLGGRYAFGVNIITQQVSGGVGDYLSYLVRNGTETLAVGSLENIQGQALQNNACGFGIFSAGDTIISRVIMNGPSTNTHFASTAADPRGFWMAYLGT